MKDFKDRVAVVTGGASGIGLGLAHRCAAEGMKIVLADVEGPALKESERSLKAGGAEVLGIHADVSKHTDVEMVRDKTLAAFGGVHLLFNNAGVQASKATAFWESSLNDWHWVVGVNLWGVIHGIRTFLPVMVAQNEPAHVVNTASMAGLFPTTVNGIYSVTKSAVVNLSEDLYLQVGERGLPIGVTVVCPSFVRTRLNEAERNRPADLAGPPAPPLPPERAELVKNFEALNETGTPPDEFAGFVFDAIRADRLYCLPHRDRVEVLRERVENIISGTNPSRGGY